MGQVSLSPVTAPVNINPRSVPKPKLHLTKWPVEWWQAPISEQEFVKQHVQWSMERLESPKSKLKQISRILEFLEVKLLARCPHLQSKVKFIKVCVIKVSLRNTLIRFPKMSPCILTETTACLSGPLIQGWNTSLRDANELPAKIFRLLQELISSEGISGSDYSRDSQALTHPCSGGSNDQNGRTVFSGKRGDNYGRGTLQLC